MITTLIYVVIIIAVITVINAMVQNRQKNNDELLKMINKDKK